MNPEGIVTLATFVLVVALIAFILSHYSYETQAIIITVLLVIGFVADRLLLHFFREYFVNQWYFTSVDSLKGHREGIIVPFIFIGAIVYWFIAKVTTKYCKR